MVYTRLSVFILLVNAHKRHVFLLNFDLLSFFFLWGDRLQKKKC